MPALIVVGGLPATGKTTLARELARRIGAVYLRIDSIEQALGQRPMEDAGYRVAYAVAADNLRLGRTVVADCVNPIAVTRDAWRTVAEDIVEIEVVCLDPAEHRRRVENRVADIAGLRLPSWNEVLAREYEPWQRGHIVIDTAGSTPTEASDELWRLLHSSEK